MPAKTPTRHKLEKTCRISPLLSVTAQHDMHLGASGFKHLVGEGHPPASSSGPILLLVRAHPQRATPRFQRRFRSPSLALGEKTKISHNQDWLIRTSREWARTRNASCRGLRRHTAVWIQYAGD